MRVVLDSPILARLLAGRQHVLENLRRHPHGGGAAGCKQPPRLRVGRGARLSQVAAEDIGAGKGADARLKALGEPRNGLRRGSAALAFHTRSITERQSQNHERSGHRPASLGDIHAGGKSRSQTDSNTFVECKLGCPGEENSLRTGMPIPEQLHRAISVDHLLPLSGFEERDCLRLQRRVLRPRHLRDFTASQAAVCARRASELLMILMDSNDCSSGFR